MSIVADTAIPYAAARLSDLPKPIVRPRRHDHQKPVDRSNIDLAVAFLRGLVDGHAR